LFRSLRPSRFEAVLPFRAWKDSACGHGLPADELTGLAWDHRDDGHCGAGAPRWNINAHSSFTGND
jgi:hypothetical protein